MNYFGWYYYGTLAVIALSWFACAVYATVTAERNLQRINDLQQKLDAIRQDIEEARHAHRSEQ